MRFIVFLVSFLLSTAALAQVAPIPPSNLQAGGLQGQEQYNSSGSFAGNSGYTIVAAAKCNGTTDDSSAINTAIQTANTAGGGIVKLPAGTCMVGSTIVMYTGVQLVGAGRYATTIKALSTLSGASPVIETLDYASLVGTSSTGGPYMWAIENMTINGNKTARSGTGGQDIAIFGYDYLLRDIDVSWASGDGIDAAWGSESSGIYCGEPSLGAACFETHYDHVRVWAANGNGFDYNGPTDSYFNDVEPFLNVGDGAIFQDLNGTGASVTNGHISHMHSWGNGAAGIVIDGEVDMVNVESESNNGDCHSDPTDFCPGYTPSGGDGIDVISTSGHGQINGVNIYTWGNSNGTGLSIANPGYGTAQGVNAIANLQSYGNGVYGVNINIGTTGPTTTLTNVSIDNNHDGGIYTCTAGTDGGSGLVVVGGQLTDNGSFAIENCMYETHWSNLRIFNNGGGIISTGTANFDNSFSNMELISDGAGPEINMGTGANSNLFITAQVYTGAGDYCWLGTPATTSSLNINCQGSGNNDSINTISSPSVSNGQVYPILTNSSVTSTSGTTLTAAEMVGGIITRSGPTGSGFTDTTDTASNLLSSLGAAQVGASFTFRVVNTSAETETLAGGTGVTLPTATASKQITSGDWASYSCVVTSSSAVTCYETGTGAN